MVGTVAAVSLAAERGRVRWVGGEGGEPRLLDGVRGRIAVARSKLGPSGGDGGDAAGRGGASLDACAGHGDSVSHADRVRAGSALDVQSLERGDPELAGAPLVVCEGRDVIDVAGGARARPARGDDDLPGARRPRPKRSIARARPS